VSDRAPALRELFGSLISSRHSRKAGGVEAYRSGDDFVVVDVVIVDLSAGAAA